MDTIDIVALWRQLISIDLSLYFSLSLLLFSLRLRPPTINCDLSSTTPIRKIANKSNNSSLPISFVCRNSGSCLNNSDVALRQSVLNSQFANHLSSTPQPQPLPLNQPSSASHNQSAESAEPLVDPKRVSELPNGRNGVNRLINFDFIRNAIFGHGSNTQRNNGSTCDAKDYKILNHSISSQSDQYIHPI